MNIKSVLSIELVSLGLVAGGVAYINAPKVEASSWHEGTPKVLRGFWIHGYHNSVTVNAKSYSFTGAMTPMFKNAKWRSLGKHKYQLRGYQYNSSLKKGYYKLTLGRVGKRLAMYGNGSKPELYSKHARI